MDGQRGRCGPYAAQYAQHSLTGTVQSSTRGLSSLVRHSPFCLISPMPPFLPRRTPRPLTFYHHNRYIIPRSVFYSRVTPWNAFVRDIVRLSLLPVLYFPLSSVFFSRRLFDRRDRFFSFFRYGVFFKIRLWCRSRWRSLHAVELNSMGIIARSFIDSRF